MRKTFLTTAILLGLGGVALAQYVPDSYDEPEDTYDDLPGDDTSAVPQAPPEQAGVSLQTFDQTLAPYGDWVIVNGYGRAWRPNPAVVGVDFRPYASGGHWAYSSYGWTWVSDWSWGWAPFHYGRWYADASYGWVWIPDTTWGPAWVDWRYGDGTVGWAALPPLGVRASLSWCFVPQQRFRSRNVYRYLAPSHYYYQRTAPVRRAVIWGNRRWNGGPRISDFRRYATVAPSYRAPAYRAPAYRAPAYRAPAYRAPAYRAPAYNAPAYRAPAYRAPAYRQPTYTAPAYRAPAYRAPAYRAPAYRGSNDNGRGNRGDRGDRGRHRGWR